MWISPIWDLCRQDDTKWLWQTELPAPLHRDANTKDHQAEPICPQTFLSLRPPPWPAHTYTHTESSFSLSRVDVIWDALRPPVSPGLESGQPSIFQPAALIVPACSPQFALHHQLHSQLAKGSIFSCFRQDMDIKSSSEQNAGPAGISKVCGPSTHAKGHSWSEWKKSGRRGERD